MKTKNYFYYADCIWLDEAYHFLVILSAATMAKGMKQNPDLGGRIQNILFQKSRIEGLLEGIDIEGALPVADDYTAERFAKENATKGFIPVFSIAEFNKKINQLVRGELRR